MIVVYKVDRLTRSLADFAKLVEAFDARGVSFVSVTQSFNTTSSMGRLTLNVLLSFAQFEREVIGERVRDKIAASKRKGIYDAVAHQLDGRRQFSDRAVGSRLVHRESGLMGIFVTTTIGGMSGGASLSSTGLRFEREQCRARRSAEDLAERMPQTPAGQ